MKTGQGWSWLFLLVIGVSSAWPQAGRCDEQRGWSLTAGAGVARLDVEESIDPKPDLGFRVGLAGGFRFNRNLAVELDAGYVRNTFTRSRLVSRRTEKFHQVPVVAFLVGSFANESAFEPFIGAGLGAVYEQWGDSQGGDACLGFRGGVRYGLGERMAIGADYTFYMLGVSSAFIGEAVGIDTGNLSLRWKY